MTKIRFPYVAAGLAFVASAIAFPRLPQCYPMQFGLSGTAHSFGSRTEGALLFPAFMVLLAAFDGRARRIAGERMMTVLAAGMLAIHVVTLRVALSDGRLGAASWIVLGALFVAIGLTLPRVRQNTWLGIRTPWSLRSPEAWARSQRVGGIAFALAGLAFIASAPCSGPSVETLRGAAIITAAVVPLVYSMFAGRHA